MDILPATWKVWFRLWFIHWVKLIESLAGIISLGFWHPTWFVKSSEKVITRYQNKPIEKAGFSERIKRFIFAFFKILDKDIL